MEGITLHNLANVDADVPLVILTAVTGVSGSGKSTLLQVVAKAAGVQVNTADPASLPADGDVAAVAPREGPDGPVVSKMAGLDPADRLVQADQRPIGRTPGCLTPCAANSRQRPGPRIRRRTVLLQRRRRTV